MTREDYERLKKATYRMKDTYYTMNKHMEAIREGLKLVAEKNPSPKHCFVCGTVGVKQTLYISTNVLEKTNIVLCNEHAACYVCKASIIKKIKESPSTSPSPLTYFKIMYVDLNDDNDGLYDTWHLLTQRTYNDRKELAKLSLIKQRIENLTTPPDGQEAINPWQMVVPVCNDCFEKDVKSEENVKGICAVCTELLIKTYQSFTKQNKKLKAHNHQEIGDNTHECHYCYNRTVRVADSLEDPFFPNDTFVLMNSVLHYVCYDCRAHELLGTCTECGDPVFSFNGIEKYSTWDEEYFYLCKDCDDIGY